MQDYNVLVKDSNKILSQKSPFIGLCPQSTTTTILFSGIHYQQGCVSGRSLASPCIYMHKLTHIHIRVLFYSYINRDVGRERQRCALCFFLVSFYITRLRAPSMSIPTDWLPFYLVPLEHPKVWISHNVYDDFIINEHFGCPTSLINENKQRHKQGQSSQGKAVV